MKIILSRKGFDSSNGNVASPIFPSGELCTLPGWFYPGTEKAGLSYHGDLKRWTLEDDHVLLNSVGRGQEFVLDCAAYPEAVQWLSTLLCL